MVERAAASGVARAAGETPAQYAIRLRDFLMVSAAASPAEPDESTEGATASEASPLTAEQSQSTHGSAEVSELTNAFMRIRYARQVATAPEASALATIWQKISDRLQLTKR
jgi:hypothetical protein